MTERSVRGSPEEGFVVVLDTYSYQRNDRTLDMKKGETLMLLKKATDDWWQVIRQGEKRSFWAPAKYLEVINIPPEQMKQNLKQGQAFEKVPGTFNSEHNVPTGKPISLSLPLDGKCVPQASEMPSPSNPLASHSYLTKIETGRISVERSDPYPARSMSTSSFKSESPHVPTKGFPPRSGSNELLSPAIYSRGLPPHGSHESSSSHTSRSSLYDGSRCSTESLTHPHGKKHVMKAASHDELSSGDHCRSSLDISQPRASSSEELDGRYSGRDYLFRSNQLSYRHRSNSVDFKMFQKDLSFSEMKQGSLDKSRKQRLSKDPGNRRRSWAVEEMRTPDSYRSSLKKGETQDVSIILDVPPKLPPKQKKNRLSDMFSSGSDNIGKLEGPIDIKVQELKSNKPAIPQTAPNAKRLSQEYDRGNLAKVSETLLTSDNQRRGYASRYEGQERKEPPVALPRKILHVQSMSIDEKLEQKQVVSNSSISHPSIPIGDTLMRDNNGNQVKRERQENDSEYGSYQEKTHFGEGGEERQKYNTPSSFGKIPGTPDLLRKVNETPDSTRKIYTAQDIPRSWGFSDSSVKPIGKRSEDIKEEEEEKENEYRYPPRETPTPDSSRGGKSSSQFPPSPKCIPKRELFSDWGEYWDDTSHRVFFYNRITREKRWKPPRKDVSSIAIPEVPHLSRGDGFDLGGRPQPRSPPPDYPGSPKMFQRFVYNNQLEGGAFPPSPSRSSTLNFSSNRSPRHPMATSQTLPAFPSNAFPINTPPAPPASAKPLHIPSTPTTPKSPDIPEFSEADQKSALLDVLYNLSPPKGWIKKYDAYTQRVYFHNTVTGARWLATNTEDGKIYYYEESGSKSQWKLTEQDECDNSYDGKETANRPTSPNENLRISLLLENLNEYSNNIEKEGFLHRTFIMREGKKCRKNWTQSYVRYIIGPFNTGSSGLLHFSKNKDDDKKPEMFEFYNVCHLERTNDKKTSRQQVLGLRNGRDTEVLLQFDDKDIADEWFKILANHEGMQYDDTPIPEKEDKKGKRGSDKVKRESSMDSLNPDNKGITDKLRSFIKRRPLKETLEKKGIYKEAIFGSTLAELASQDKTVIPIFVLQCINHIEKSEENLCTDGLYRISGNAAQIQKIRYEVAQRNYTILSKEKDVHNLAGSLKLFFRELKEPLIPYTNYVDFIQATGSEFRRMNQQAEKLNKAVRKLPTENYETLKVLLQHLLRVTEFESKNRMSLSNLAIVFGPCLLWPKETTSSDLMTDVMLHNRVIEGLLTDFPKVFTARR